VNLPINNAAQRRTALATKLQPRAIDIDIGREQLCAGGPAKFSGLDQCIRRGLGAERLTAARAVARPRIAKFAIDLILHLPAKTLARYRHSTLPGAYHRIRRFGRFYCLINCQRSSKPSPGFSNHRIHSVALYPAAPVAKIYRLTHRIAKPVSSDLPGPAECFNRVCR